jgi:hypothetical protein
VSENTKDGDDNREDDDHDGEPRQTARTSNNTKMLDLRHNKKGNLDQTYIAYLQPTLSIDTCGRATLGTTLRTSSSHGHMPAALRPRMSTSSASPMWFRARCRAKASSDSATPPRRRCRTWVRIRVSC